MTFSKPLISKAFVGCCLMAALAGCRLFRASPKVAFLGDSITAGWGYPTVNDGLYGNTTGQMLARFNGLIPNRGYTTVVLLGGTNDILRHVDPATTIQNIQQIGELTVQNHAEPILCEIPPIFHNYDHTDHTDFHLQVIDLNRRIADLARAHHWKLVDYYTPLVDHPDYLIDGVHMRLRGYAVMEEALHKQLPR